MKRALILLLLCLMSGAPAGAASDLDAQRLQAQEGRERVRELRSRQQALRAELNTLAGRIEQLKAGPRGPLGAGAELEGALRRSQELSSALTALAQSLATAESEAERRHLVLHTALSAALGQARAEWESTSERRARGPLLERMRVLRAEREAIRAALPTAQVTLPPEESSPRDDAEELLEQADALRDTGDKVAQRLQALRARLAEVREERELDRRMSDFLGEESMFDEQDRRLNVRVDSTTREFSVNATPRPGWGISAPIAGAPAAAEPGPSVPSPTPSPSPGAPAPGVPPPITLPTTPTNPPSRDSVGSGTPTSSIHSATDSRPQVGTVRAQVLASELPDDPRALEQEAARLESLARGLDARVKELEQRARELR